MGTKPQMVIVTALVRPQMEGPVVRALHDLPEFPGFFIAEVRGQGRGRGAGGSYRATEFELTYHHFLQLQIVCDASAAARILDIVATAAWTGQRGDGVIFASAAQSFGRIRDLGRPREELHND